MGPGKFVEVGVLLMGMTTTLTDMCGTGAISRVLALGLVLAGCGEDGPADAADETGETGTSAEDGAADGSSGDAGEPVPEVEHVPLTTESIELGARCFELSQPVSQPSVSPEGHLWLRLDEQTWRVIDPLGLESEQVLPATVEQLSARSHDRALILAEGVISDVRGEWPSALPWPDTLPAPTQLCGDPSHDANGFVVASSLVHRDHGQWWQWTDPAGEQWDDIRWLASNAGVCLGSDGELWLGEHSGEVWRITVDYAQRVEALDGAEDAVLVDGDGVAARLEDALWVGDDELTQVTFEAGPVTELSAGDRTLWVSAGGRLYRRLDGVFEAATTDGEPVVPGTLLAEAGGGVWSLTDDRACHFDPVSRVRIEGVHHLQRLSDEEVALVFEPEAGDIVRAARLDGQALALVPENGRWRTAALALTTGWHEVEVDTDARSRSLRFEQRRVGELTWTDDIEPLFEAHCSGGACHGPGLADGTRPDLSTYDAWLDREISILERVVTQGTMPPAGTTEGWGLETTLMVSEWFETGAAHGGDQ